MKASSMSDKYVSTAKVIDGILILSLPDAISPVVWQMELGQSKSSALEIRNSDDGRFILTLKTPRQDAVLEIAAYANRDTAIKALLVTSSALEKAQGQLKAAPAGTSNGYPVPAVSYSPKSSGPWCFIKKAMTVIGIILGGLITLGLTIFILNIIFSSTSSGPSGTSGATSGAAADGAPVSADEFLENR